MDTDRSNSKPLIYNGLQPTPMEHPALNWFKLLFLIVMTFGSLVMFWYLFMAIETMDYNSVPASFQDAGGLIFGLFCFYVLCFGVAWRWGSGQREEMKKQAVEQQLARQKAQDALMNLQ